MCAPDPNAGARMQAKLEHQKKIAQYKSEEFKFHNRHEVTFKKGRQKIAMGRSGANSDVYQNALYTVGKANLASAANYQTASQLKSELDVGTGESRARGSKVDSSNRAAYLQLMNRQQSIESSLDSTWGTNMALRYQKIARYNANAHAKNREALGVRPEFGVPVHMPPKDKAGQFMNSMSMGLGLVSSGIGFAGLLAASDIKLKENITKEGKSLKGYTIYTWNYKNDRTTRYRGVIAQDVIKTNPMAVDIMSNGYLGVHYDKIDVPMEVVS